MLCHMTALLDTPGGTSLLLDSMASYGSPRVFIEDRVYLAPSDMKGAGWGVRAARRFEKGERVLLVLGVAMHASVAQGNTANRYTYAISTPMAQELGLTGWRLFEEAACNPCKYLNSSTSPNCEVKPVGPLLTLVASGPINKGDELTFYYDYNSEVGDAWGCVHARTTTTGCCAQGQKGTTPTKAAGAQAGPPKAMQVGMLPQAGCFAGWLCASHARPAGRDCQGQERARGEGADVPGHLSGSLSSHSPPRSSNTRSARWRRLSWTPPSLTCQRLTTQRWGHGLEREQQAFMPHRWLPSGRMLVGWTARRRGSGCSASCGRSARDWPG